MNFKFLLTFIAMICLGLSQYVAAQNAVDDQLKFIGEQNTAASAGISDGSLFVHRLTLNAGEAKTWGKYAQYQETLYCYFEIKSNTPILKKIAITTNIANRQGYADYLFDETGNLLFALDNSDIKDLNKLARYYFSGRSLIMITTPEGEPKDASNFTAENLEKGVEYMKKAANYKKVFDSLVAIQMPITR